MTNDNERRRQRYAEDSEYRERILASNRKSAAKRDKETINAQQRLKRATDPEFCEQSRLRSTKSQLKTAYGLTMEDYDRMLARQQGACAICKRKTLQRLCVDHCHLTNMVRGLLCRRCNVGLGHFEDDARLLHEAATYVEVWRAMHRRSSTGSTSLVPERGGASPRRREQRVDGHDEEDLGRKFALSEPAARGRDRNDCSREDADRGAGKFRALSAVPLSPPLGARDAGQGLQAAVPPTVLPRRGPSAQVGGGSGSCRLDKGVLVLGIADDQSPLPVPIADHESEAVDRGVDRDEGQAPVVIPARGDRAVPFPEVEDCRTVERVPFSRKAQRRI
jgi:Recombination endonuclease VII